MTPVVATCSNNLALAVCGADSARLLPPQLREKWAALAERVPLSFSDESGKVELALICETDYSGPWWSLPPCQDLGRKVRWVNFPS